MGTTTIEWTHRQHNGIDIPGYTFNPWIGCTKIAPECANCYAETLMDTRYKRVKWGKGEARSRTSEANWKKPLQWNKAAAALPLRPLVFCASLADWLDDEVPIEWLGDLLLLIDATPNLQWLLLSKRVERWSDRLFKVAEDGDDEPSRVAGCWLDGERLSNVAIGATAGCQTTWDQNVPALLNIPSDTHFVSVEPLLGEINFGLPVVDPVSYTVLLNWVIVGGESGANARRCDAAWMRHVRNQCVDNGIAFFVKQLGDRFTDGDYPESDYSKIKGKITDPALFPIGLDYRQFPNFEGCKQCN